MTAQGEVDVGAFLPGPSALVLAGGLNHGYDQGCAPLVELLEARGLEPAVVQEPADLALLDHDLLAVDALWWRMEGERYDATREEWARDLPDAARAAVESHVEQGRPVLAVHTASICFDDWPRWGEIVGAAWNWERSSHPPLSEDPVHVDVRTDAHAIVAGVPDFDVVDEVYGTLDLQPGIVVLATSEHGGVDHPVVIAHTLASGSRVVYDALGHDRRSMEQPEHRRILIQAIDWLLGP